MRADLHIIVTAAGSGRRLGRDKIWLPIQGQPLILHTLDLFSSLENVASRVVTLAAPAMRDEWPSLPGKIQHQWQAVEGGSSREASVWNGIRALNRTGGEDLILIHDGARPSLSGEDLVHLLEEANTRGSAVALTPVNDTLKRMEEGVITGTVDRTNLFRALTPQIFRYSTLLAAFERRADSLDEFTDEASLVESMGEKVHGVILKQPNPKLTMPQDLPLLQALLEWVSGPPPNECN